jgi:hypothetical protein
VSGDLISDPRLIDRSVPNSLDPLHSPESADAGGGTRLTIAAGQLNGCGRRTVPCNLSVPGPEESRIA